MYSVVVEGTRIIRSDSAVDIGVSCLCVYVRVAINVCLVCPSQYHGASRRMYE